ncbi:unnamed protein product [Amoebophrya sp. A25]|nr:unnamed protein product [Amoebophrya sp. A25]|eukprot:GSA25T00005011001.1
MSREQLGEQWEAVGFDDTPGPFLPAFSPRDVPADFLVQCWQCGAVLSSRGEKTKGRRCLHCCLLFCPDCTRELKDSETALYASIFEVGGELGGSSGGGGGHGGGNTSAAIQQGILQNHQPAVPGPSTGAAASSGPLMLAGGTIGDSGGNQHHAVSASGGNPAASITASQGADAIPVLCCSGGKSSCYRWFQDVSRVIPSREAIEPAVRQISKLSLSELVQCAKHGEVCRNPPALRRIATTDEEEEPVVLTWEVDQAAVTSTSGTSGAPGGKNGTTSTMSTARAIVVEQVPLSPSASPSRVIKEVEILQPSSADEEATATGGITDVHDDFMLTDADDSLIESNEKMSTGSASRLGSLFSNTKSLFREKASPLGALFQGAGGGSLSTTGTTGTSTPPTGALSQTKVEHPKHDSLNAAQNDTIDPTAPATVASTRTQNHPTPDAATTARKLRKTLASLKLRCVDRLGRSSRTKFTALERKLVAPFRRHLVEQNYWSVAKLVQMSMDFDDAVDVALLAELLLNHANTSSKMTVVGSEGGGGGGGADHLQQHLQLDINTAAHSFPTSTSTTKTEVVHQEVLQKSSSSSSAENLLQETILSHHGVVSEEVLNRTSNLELVFLIASVLGWLNKALSSQKKKLRRTSFFRTSTAGSSGGAPSITGPGSAPPPLHASQVQQPQANGTSMVAGVGLSASTMMTASRGPAATGEQGGSGLPDLQADDTTGPLASPPGLPVRTSSENLGNSAKLSDRSSTRGSSPACSQLLGAHRGVSASSQQLSRTGSNTGPPLLSRMASQQTTTSSVKDMPLNAVFGGGSGTAGTTGITKSLTRRGNNQIISPALVQTLMSLGWFFSVQYPSVQRLIPIVQSVLLPRLEVKSFLAEVLLDWLAMVDNLYRELVAVLHTSPGPSGSPAATTCSGGHGILASSTTTSGGGGPLTSLFRRSDVSGDRSSTLGGGGSTAGTGTANANHFASNTFSSRGGSVVALNTSAPPSAKDNSPDDLPRTTSFAGGDAFSMCDENLDEYVLENLQKLESLVQLLHELREQIFQTLFSFFFPAQLAELLSYNPETVARFASEQEKAVAFNPPSMSGVNTNDRTSASGDIRNQEIAGGGPGIFPTASATGTSVGGPSQASSFSSSAPGSGAFHSAATKQDDNLSVEMLPALPTTAVAAEVVPVLTSSRRSVSSAEDAVLTSASAQRTRIIAGGNVEHYTPGASPRPPPPPVGGGQLAAHQHIYPPQGSPRRRNILDEASVTSTTATATSGGGHPDAHATGGRGQSCQNRSSSAQQSPRVSSFRPPSRRQSAISACSVGSAAGGIVDGTVGTVVFNSSQVEQLLRQRQFEFTGVASPTTVASPRFFPTTAAGGGGLTTPVTTTQQGQQGGHQAGNNLTLSNISATSSGSGSSSSTPGGAFLSGMVSPPPGTATSVQLLEGTVGLQPGEVGVGEHQGRFGVVPAQGRFGGVPIRKGFSKNHHQGGAGTNGSGDPTASSSTPRSHATHCSRKKLLNTERRVSFDDKPLTTTFLQPGSSPPKDLVEEGASGVPVGEACGDPLAASDSETEGEPKAATAASSASSSGCASFTLEPIEADVDDGGTLGSTITSTGLSLPSPTGGGKSMLTALKPTTSNSSGSSIDSTTAPGGAGGSTVTVGGSSSSTSKTPPCSTASGTTAPASSFATGGASSQVHHINDKNTTSSKTCSSAAPVVYSPTGVVSFTPSGDVWDAVSLRLCRERLSARWAYQYWQRLLQSCAHSLLVQQEFLQTLVHEPSFLCDFGFEAGKIEFLQLGSIKGAKLLGESNSQSRAMLVKVFHQQQVMQLQPVLEQHQQRLEKGGRFLQQDEEGRKVDAVTESAAITPSSLTATIETRTDSVSQPVAPPSSEGQRIQGSIPSAADIIKVAGKDKVNLAQADNLIKPDHQPQLSSSHQNQPNTDTVTKEDSNLNVSASSSSSSASADDSCGGAACSTPTTTTQDTASNLALLPASTQKQGSTPASGRPASSSKTRTLARKPSLLDDIKTSEDLYSRARSSKPKFVMRVEEEDQDDDAASFGGSSVDSVDLAESDDQGGNGAGAQNQEVKETKNAGDDDNKASKSEPQAETSDRGDDVEKVVGEEGPPQPAPAPPEKKAITNQLQVEEQEPPKAIPPTADDPPSAVQMAEPSSSATAEATASSAVAATHHIHQQHAPHSCTLPSTLPSLCPTPMYPTTSPTAAPAAIEKKLLLIKKGDKDTLRKEIWASLVIQLFHEILYADPRVIAKLEDIGCSVDDFTGTAFRILQYDKETIIVCCVANAFTLRDIARGRDIKTSTELAQESAEEMEECCAVDRSALSASHHMSMSSMQAPTAGSMSNSCIVGGPGGDGLAGGGGANKNRSTSTAAPMHSSTSQLPAARGGQKHSLADFLHRHNEPPHDEFARRRLAWSAATALVFSFVLGLGDRHQENVMITKTGVMFHIDFGFVLGEEPLNLVNLVTKAKPIRFDYTELYGALGHKCTVEVFWPALGIIFNALRPECYLIAKFVNKHLGPSSEKLTAFLSSRLQPCLTDEQGEAFIVQVVTRAKESQAQQWLKDRIHQLELGQMVHRGKDWTANIASSFGSLITSGAAELGSSFFGSEKL